MNRTRVLLRAFGREPLVRYALLDPFGHVLVSSEKAIREAEINGGTPVSGGWPPEDIFEYDEALYEELAEAYRGGDIERLTALWERAVPFAPEVAAV